MPKLKVGQSVKFVYHNKVRQGKVERLFDKNGARFPSFCVDHGDYFKSYRQSKAKFLVT
jgi:hypothetical protein